MKLLNDVLTSAGRAGCVLFVLSSGTRAEDLVKPALDISNFIKSRQAGTATTSQANEAADGVAKLGIAASAKAAAILTNGNPVAAATNATIGSALIPIVKSEGIQIQKNQSLIVELDKAIRENDSNKIAELSARGDAQITDNANWKPPYASSSASLWAITQAVDPPGENGLFNAVKKVADFVSSFGTDITPASTASTASTDRNGNFEQAPVNSEKPIPTCGTLEYYDTIGGTCKTNETTSEPELTNEWGWGIRGASDCMPLPPDFKDFVAMEIGGSDGICKILQTSERNGTLIYLSQCDIVPHQRQFGTILKQTEFTPISQNEIKRFEKYANGDSSTLVYFQCRLPAEAPSAQIDCSPKGQEAYRAAHGKPVGYVCQNPL